jgi:hypothetical protein
MDRVEKSFEYAAEASKQMIALGTGVLALTVTFFKDAVQVQSRAATLVLVFGWIAYLLSVVTGVGTLASMAGQLEKLKGEDQPSIYKKPVRALARVQAVSFILGTILVVAAGIIVVACGSPPPPPPPPTHGG